MSATAIIFCRISCDNNSNSNKNMSLDSQEYAIRNILKCKVYTTIKAVGSAYKSCEPQQQLSSVLHNTRYKTIYVYEPSRLSRNVESFLKLWHICYYRKHKIYILSLNRFFSTDDQKDFDDLLNYIILAQKESEDLGNRISRSYQYKKSREPVWGKTRDENNDIVDNPMEQKISKLICLLGTPGSSVTEISNLIEEVGVTQYKEKFSLVEYSRSSCEEIDVTHLPYAMSPKNIIDTLKYYEIKHRGRLTWYNKEIFDILKNKNDTKNVNGYNTSIDDLVNAFEIISKEEENKEEEKKEEIESPKKVKEWIYIWYDPSSGLPPNITLPKGMVLPNFPCELYLPKN